MSSPYTRLVRVEFSPHALARFRQFRQDPGLTEADAAESYRMGQPISREEAAALIQGYIRRTRRDAFYRADGAGPGVWVLVRPGRGRPVALTYLAPGMEDDGEALAMGGA